MDRKAGHGEHCSFFRSYDTATEGGVDLRSLQFFGQLISPETNPPLTLPPTLYLFTHYTNKSLLYMKILRSLKFHPLQQWLSNIFPGPSENS